MIVVRRFVFHLMELTFLLLSIAVATFLFLHLLPGDPAQMYAGVEATEAELEGVRQRMGLDRPLLVQIGSYLGRVTRGDLGISLRTGNPVASEIAARLEVTGRLALLSTLIALGTALLLGGVPTMRPEGGLASLVEWVGLTVLAIPVYWLGLLLVLLFSAELRWFPPAGGETWRHLVLPSVALGVHTGAAGARILRASLGEALRKAYLLTARGKGASARRAGWVHGLPNALVPVIAFFGVEAGQMFGGAVLTETVFALNGLGRYLVQSIAFRDYPAVAGCVLIGAAVVALANAVADAFCSLIDPRTRRAG